MREDNKNIQSMFNSIANSYDFLNRLLSFKRDSIWRKKAIKLLQIEEEHKILDIACGTGDMIVEILKKYPNNLIIGSDFSINMVQIGKKKLPKNIFSIADAHNLPFKDKAFDRLTIAFGFRNITNKKKALKEFYRILKPNGKVCILEFSQPENLLFAKLYKFYFKKILPNIGGLFSGNKLAYKYLPDSVYKFPNREKYKQMILSAGFNNISFIPLTFGIVTTTIISKKVN